MGRASRRLVVAAGAAVVALGVWASPASAHVEPTVTTAAPGGEVTSALQVPHGCDGSPTTKIEVKVPDGVESFKPQQLAGWTITSTNRKVDPPVTEDGETITETLDTVTWTAQPGQELPDSQMQEFGFTASMPKDKEGTVVAFPTVQTCVQGETQWIEPTKEGQPEPDHPAPAITLTGTADDHHTEAETAATTTSSSSSDDTSNTLGIIGIVVGTLGLIVGGVALARSTKRIGTASGTDN